MDIKKSSRFISCVIMSVLAGNVTTIRAAESDDLPAEKNNWGGKLIKSPFGLGLDVQTKYVWRGMEMIDRKSVV